jgi:hypothetical protein
LLRANVSGAQDFSIFYSGSRIILSGDSSHLYDLPTQARYQTAAYRSKPLPFNHPAYELILFLPLTVLPFDAAYWVWFVLCVAIMFLTSVLVSRTLTNFPRQASLWAFAVAAASFPLVWTLCQGQDSIVLLLIFAVTFISLRSGRDLVAGLVLAAGLFKFTLVVPFVLPFFFRRNWRFVAGFLAGAVAFTGISVAITGIDGAHRYVQLLSLLAAHPLVGYINPLLMPDARGFLVTVLTGTGLRRHEFEVISTAVSALLLLVPILTFVDRKEPNRFDLWFALDVTIALMVSPHLYWHDLSVLLLPILLAANLLLRSANPIRLTLLAAVPWLALYMSPWPVSIAATLNISPSIFFVPLCLSALWFVLKIRSLAPPKVIDVASEIAV